MLLERNHVIPDPPDKDRRTPLWWGAEFGHEEIVKMLSSPWDLTPMPPIKAVKHLSRGLQNADTRESWKFTPKRAT